MAFLTSSDLADITTTHKHALNNYFTNKWKSEIDYELDMTVSALQEDKVRFLHELKENISHLRTAEVVVRVARSFDFRNVGGADATYELEHTGNIFTGDFDTEHITFRDKAKNNWPSSWVDNVNIFNIWRSKDFLKKLAERLGLPENVYFVIRTSHDDKCLHTFKDRDVVQYKNKLVMVYRFSRGN